MATIKTSSWRGKTIETNMVNKVGPTSLIVCAEMEVAGVGSSGWWCRALTDPLLCVIPFLSNPACYDTAKVTVLTDHPSYVTASVWQARSHKRGGSTEQISWLRRCHELQAYRKVLYTSRFLFCSLGSNTFICWGSGDFFGGTIFLKIICYLSLIIFFCTSS